MDEMRKNLEERLFDIPMNKAAKQLARTISDTHATMTLGQALGYLTQEDMPFFDGLSLATDTLVDECEPHENVDFLLAVGDVLYPALCREKIGDLLLKGDGLAERRIHALTYLLHVYEARYKFLFLSSVCDNRAVAC